MRKPHQSKQELASRSSLTSLPYNRISKKTKWDDLAFSLKRPHRPHQKNKENRGPTFFGSAYKMRSQTTDVYVNPVTNNLEQRKETFLYDQAHLPTHIDVVEAAEKLSQKNHRIPTYRPVKRIVKVSDQGSPLAVETPNGSILAKKINLGFACIFDNLPPATPLSKKIELVAQAKAFQNSAERHTIQEIHTRYKQQTAFVDEAQLQATRQENARHHFVRQVSQNQVMAAEGVAAKHAGATSYAQKHFYQVNLRWEWFHLVAHMILGEMAQRSDNLAAGTVQDNTLLLLPEGQIPYLARIYPEGFKLNIIVELIPGTHLAKHIDYWMITPDFPLRFAFEAQQTIDVFASYEKLIQGFVQTMVELSKQKQHRESIQKTARNLLPFFDKSQTLTPVRRSERLANQIKTFGC